MNRTIHYLFSYISFNKVVVLKVFTYPEFSRLLTLNFICSIHIDGESFYLLKETI